MIAIAAVACALTASAWADTRFGGWQGTLGSQPIHLCYTAQGAGYAPKAYYYDRILKVIDLRDVEGGAPAGTGDSAAGNVEPSEVALEESRNARIVLLKPEGDAMSGRWENGTRKVEIRLRRIAGSSSESPCGGDAFNSTLEKRFKVTHRARSLGGVAYDEIQASFGGPHSIEYRGFRLTGGSSINQVINKGIDDQMPANDEALRNRFQSYSRNALARNGSECEYTFEAEPQAVTSRWLLVSFGESANCGGHQTAVYGWKTFDRTTGKLFSVFDYLEPHEVKAGAGRPTMVDWPGFRALLDHAWRAQPNAVDWCADVGGSPQTAWLMHPTREALVFNAELPGSMMACAGDIEIPWAKLTPLLSAEGRKVLAGMQAEISTVRFPQK